MREFYGELIERYSRLDGEFFFSEAFDPAWVLEQLDDCLAIRDRELFGIPFGVKDVFNTNVLPTSMGSEIWKGFRAGNNARIVDEITDRGGIVFGKTTTAEFAVHYIQHGSTLNPHDPNRIAGTSSAGSAVAVACGALPIGLGTQTAGSIVRPASFCGVYGFKPSFGALDRTGCLKTADTLDTIGLLGSDMYGLSQTFSATFQRDRNYPFAHRYFDEMRDFHKKDKVRVGVIDTQFEGYADYDPCVKEDFEAAVEGLAGAGIEICHVDGLELINDVHSLHDIIYCKSLSYYFQNEFEHGSGMSDVMSEMISLGSRISAEEYVDALNRQPEYRLRVDEITAPYDFLVTPSTASVAPMIGEKEKDDTCLIWSFLGYPVLSVPAFSSTEHNAPFGLQIIARRFADLPLLAFGERVVGLLREL
jgi:Asp-tRNA(Asn)/Glu-tRNA(Gln) amidotransferase A subunit family amidase